MAAAEAYYASQEEGLDLRFRNEVARVLRRIQANPRLYPVSEKTPYRKAALRVFPFCIYYVIEQDKAIVLAVHDARRDPNLWKKRS